jgi:hypothetical protein
LFFVFLGIAELYKNFSSLFYTDQKFTFRKIISTRCDINQKTHENFQKYEEQIPILTILKKPSKAIEFIPAPIVTSPEPSSQEELEFARKFSISGIKFDHVKVPMQYKPYFDQPHPYFASTGNIPAFSSAFQNPVHNNDPLTSNGANNTHVCYTEMHINPINSEIPIVIDRQDKITRK